MLKLQFNGADDHSEYLYPISDAAALRDGSSTASTSGLDHLSLHLTQAPPQARAQIHGDGILSPEHGSTNGVHSHHLNGSASAMHQLGTPAAAEAVTGDKELYEEIKACEEWADVLDVVADEAKVMSLRTGVQALNRVNTLAKHLPRAQIDLISKHPGFMNLVAIVFSQVESMNPIQLSNSLYAVSQLRVPIPADVLQQYAQTAGVKAKDFWPRDISMFMYALAQLHAQPSRDTLDRLCFRAVVSSTGGSVDVITL